MEKDSSKEYKAFKELVQSNLVRFWDDTKDIKIAIHETLSEFNYRKELIGWVRGDNAINSNLLAEEIARLTKENSELRTTLDSHKQQATVLYAGLTFDELKELLISRNTTKLNGEDCNLYDFLLLVGETVAKKGVFAKEMKNGFTKLALFKLVYKIESSYRLTDIMYEFSDEGHSFYLKALWLSENNNSNH